jgi:hypothetical protein
MNPNRKTAIIVGVLFIIGTVSGILGGIFTGPILDASDYLVQIVAHEAQIISGAFFVLLMGLALTMVPVMMFPIFKKENEALALGTVIFRGPLEATMYILMAVSWLLLILVSQEYAMNGKLGFAQFQALGAVLLKMNDMINPVLEIIFSLGALMFYTLFYQSRLIPRWLSGWGLIGAIVYLAAGMMALFGTGMDFLLAPLGLQEMVMAVWLIFKGFNNTATTARNQ